MKSDLKQRIGKDSRTQAGRISLIAKIKTENNFKQDFDQRNYIVSNKKLESQGWFPIFTLEEGIEELIQGYQLITK